MDGASFFAKRLREMRMQAGLSQVDLAERAGITQGQVSNLEKEVAAPVWATVVKLAEALGCSCQDFLTEPGKEIESPKRGRPAKAEEPAPVKKGRKGK